MFLVLFCSLGNGQGKEPQKLDHSDITKPEFFPILPWEPQHGWKKPFVNRGENGLESIADCNFNMAGFVLPGDLPKCRQLGLGAILFPSDPDFDSAKVYLKAWKNLSDAEIDRRVKSMVKAAGSNPAIKGFYIMDEPGVEDFPALGKAVAAVKKYAPGKMAYINLYPNYATIGAPDTSQLGTANYTEYLERFVSEVKPQFISYDNYMVQMSGDLTNKAKASRYFSNLLEVRRVAQKHRLPFLNIVTSNQIRPFSTPPSPANLLYQAYTTLAAGYRGVTWFTYYQNGYVHGPIDADNRKTLTWHWLKEVNREIATLAPVMSRLTSTGVYFSAPAPFEKLPLLPGKLVESVSCPESLMIGEFKHQVGGSYVMIVNLSLERSARFNLKTHHSTMQIVSAADGLKTPFNKDGQWLVAGQGILLALE